jgi:hypothetical protein
MFDSVDVVVNASQTNTVVSADEQDKKNHCKKTIIYQFFEKINPTKHRRKHGNRNGPVFSRPIGETDGVQIRDGHKCPCAIDDESGAGDKEEHKSVDATRWMWCW